MRMREGQHLHRRAGDHPDRRAIVIANGRVVADATPAALCATHPSGKLDDVFRQLTLEAAA